MIATQPDNYTEILKQITANNAMLDRDMVKKVLVIYDEKDFFIGDSCIMFDKFKACKMFFNNTSVDLNFTIEKYVPGYSALLKHNPNIDNIFSNSWEEINYKEYDLLLCVTSEEEALFKIIARKYGEDFSNGTFCTSIFSFSRQIIDDLDHGKVVFPVYDEFFEFSCGDLGPMELYVSQEEKLWANSWLKEKGLKEYERLLIILDSTSVKSKLIKMTVYYELLTWLLGLKDVRILIFDENNIGKQEFYKQLLGPHLSQKFIFSNGLDLRKAITLLSADQVKLIFGPCTGLMHCASGIYNNFLRNGLSKEKVPLLVTYTGKYYKKHESAHYWWSNAPLMNCIIIRENQGIKEMVLLNDLTEAEKQATTGTLECVEYSSKMLLSFLSGNLKLNND